MAFIQEISESSENNLCFVVFESWAEAIIDHQASFEEAFDTVFKLDLTHVLAKGHCQNAYDKFTTTWKTYQQKDTRVSFLVLLIFYETALKPLQNKKGRKNLRYPRKKQSFYKKKVSCSTNGRD